MKNVELVNAKNPDLRASLLAMQRAAALARQTAMQTGTDLVIVENQRMVRLTAQQLQQQKQPS